MQNLGKSYGTLLKERSHGFSEAEVTHILRQVLLQLAQLHAQGQVHGAISPDALIQDPQTLAPVLTEPSNVSVAGYRAPELLATGQGSLSGDIYALGVTMLVLLTHQPPSTLQSVDGTWLWEDYCMVSDQLATVSETAVAPSMAARYANAMQMLQALEAEAGTAANVAGFAAAANVSEFSSRTMISNSVGAVSTGQGKLPSWQWGLIGAAVTIGVGLAGFSLFSWLNPKPALQSNTGNVVSSGDNLPSEASISPQPIVSASPQPITNPFEQMRFPKAVCGDPLPTNADAYPLDLYPIFVNNEDSLEAVKANFCQDALAKVRKDSGKRAVQVASFASIERAAQFRDFLSTRFSGVDVGPPTNIVQSPFNNQSQNNGRVLTNQSGKSYESETKSGLGTLARAQQAFRLENNRFASDIKNLDARIAPLFYDYRVVSADSRSTYMVAVPRQGGIKSFSLTARQDDSFSVLMCESQEPSVTPPPMPRMDVDIFSCPSGSSQVN
jgi:serine/threonine protein kinase